MIKQNQTSKSNLDEKHWQPWRFKKEIIFIDTQMWVLTCETPTDAELIQKYLHHKGHFSAAIAAAAATHPEERGIFQV